MAVTTGRFGWGWRVTTSNNLIDFECASHAGARQATLRLGDYTAGQFATEVARAMKAAHDGAGDEYACSFSFTTRKFTVSNANAFTLLFSTGAGAATDAAGWLGFDGTADRASAASHESTGTVGETSGFFYTAGVRGWAPVDPAVSNSPVTAAADGTTAALLQRKPRAIQQETDGGLRETIYFSTDKIFRIEYQMLSAAEQVLFDGLLDWLETGAPVDFRPDDTAGATINMRLVLANPGEVRNQFSWPTRSEANYGAFDFIQQLSRT